MIMISLETFTKLENTKRKAEQSYGSLGSKMSIDLLVLCRSKCLSELNTKIIFSIYQKGTGLTTCQVSGEPEHRDRLYMKLAFKAVTWNFF